MWVSRGNSPRGTPSAHSLFVCVLCVFAVCCSSTSMTPRRAFTAAQLDGRVYAIGGWNGQATQLNLVASIDPQTMRWQSAAPMNLARSQHASVVAGGNIWVVGGWSAEHGLISAVEAFLPPKNWRIVTHLPTQRREPDAALMGRRIVVAGGFDGASDAETTRILVSSKRTISTRNSGNVSQVYIRRVADWHSLPSQILSTRLAGITRRMGT